MIPNSFRDIMEDWMRRTAGQTGTATTANASSGVSKQDNHDRYVTFIRMAPIQLQAAMAALFEVVDGRSGAKPDSDQVYAAYKALCDRTARQPVTPWAFSDLLADLELHSFVHARIKSRSWHGCIREIRLDLQTDVRSRIREFLRTRFDRRACL